MTFLTCANDARNPELELDCQSDMYLPRVNEEWVLTIRSIGKCQLGTQVFALRLRKPRHRLGVLPVEMVVPVSQSQNDEACR